MTPLDARRSALSLVTAFVVAAGCGGDGGALSSPDPGQGTGLGGAPPHGSGGGCPSGGMGQGGMGQGGLGECGGAPVGGSAGSGGKPPPPSCADALKRCDHLFEYPAGTEKSVELRGDFAAGAWVTGAPMVRQGDVWRVTVGVPWDQPVAYKFFVDGTTWVNDPKNPQQIDDGNGGKNSLLAATTCAEWSCDVPPGTFDWRDAMLYFVFVDRFANGDPSNDGAKAPGVPDAANYQGGDWAGVIQKIDEGYFDELGVNALWITVPVDNTGDAGLGADGKLYSAYHGYWPRDLSKPEARFGTLETLSSLVQKAHDRQLKVIFDYAMNHVHASSPTYKDHPDWFWPITYNGKTCVCGEGCSWDDPYEARRCWFRDYLPDFDFTKPAAREFSVSNAISWAKSTGADGFRLDAVKHIEDSWLKELRARLTAEIEPTTKEHFYLVGETFTGDRQVIKQYVEPSTQLDGQFDFPLRMKLAEILLMRKGSMGDLEAFLASNDGFYGAGVMSTFIGNHDLPRPIHFAEDTPLFGDPWADGKDKAWSGTPGLPGGTSAFERLGNAFTLLFTTRGVPLIYYGDEIGLPGAGDPDNRRMMQWSGYSAGQSMLLAHLKKLTQVRAKHPALRKGNRKPVAATQNLLAYAMSYQGDEVLVAINRGDAPETLSVQGALVDALSGAAASGSVTVKPRSSVVLVAP